MQYYFIGGLGGNSYHLAPLIEKLGFPVTFLDPYRKMIQTENDRSRLKREALLYKPCRNS